MILDNIQCWCLFTEVLKELFRFASPYSSNSSDSECSMICKIFTYLNDYNGRATNFACLSFFVDFTKTGPFTKFLVWIDSNQWNLMFITQSGNQFFVLWFIATFCQNAQNGLTSRVDRKWLRQTRNYHLHKRTYPKPYMPDVYHEQDRQRWAISSKLLEELCWYPFCHRYQRLVQLGHCNVSNIIILQIQRMF